jgi:hypothetical protein
VLGISLCATSERFPPVMGRCVTTFELKSRSQRIRIIRRRKQFSSLAEEKFNNINSFPSTILWITEISFVCMYECVCLIEMKRGTSFTAEYRTSAEKFVCAISSSDRQVEIAKDTFESEIFIAISVG